MDVFISYAFDSADVYTSVKGVCQGSAHGLRKRDVVVFVVCTQMRVSHLPAYYSFVQASIKQTCGVSFPNAIHAFSCQRLRQGAMPFEKYVTALQTISCLSVV